MRKLHILILSMIFFCITCSFTMAHDYWIVPDTFHPQVSSFVGMDFSCGHTYFGKVETPDVTNFRLTLFTPDGRKLPLSYLRVDPKSARIIAPILGQGTYIIGTTSITPSFWSKTTNGWVPEPKTMAKNVVEGGKYVKSVKTFLTVRKASDTYKSILGYKIEIVPQKNPTTMNSGQSLPLLVLYNGKPVKNAVVYAVYNGYVLTDKGLYPVNAKTDTDGIAHVKLNRPGQWLVCARYQFDIPKNLDADYENYRAYIMFEIAK